MIGILMNCENSGFKYYKFTNIANKSCIGITVLCWIVLIKSMYLRCLLKYFYKEKGKVAW